MGGKAAHISPSLLISRSVIPKRSEESQVCLLKSLCRSEAKRGISVLSSDRPPEKAVSRCSAQEQQTDSLFFPSVALVKSCS